MRLLLGVITAGCLAVLVQAIPRPNFGMDQCSQCQKDSGDMGAIDCYKCCCEPPPALDAKYGPWTDMKPLCSERERVGCAQYFQGPNGEQMVHRCLALGPLGHCKQWTSGCTMEGRCPWTDKGEHWIGKFPPGWPPIKDIRNGPWTGLNPRCVVMAYSESVGCHAYELRGYDNFVRRCLSVGRPNRHGPQCTEWTEECNVREPCPWAYEERYGEPMKRIH